MTAGRKITIAIDGPAGSGKSSTAKKVAEKLDYLFLDTGAMYRCITLQVLNDGADPTDQNTSALAAKHATIRFAREGDRQKVLLNDQDVTEAIRTPEVTNNIAPVAANPKVREILVQQQRQIGANGGIVAEGRDIGTVVFPQAELKVFMIASIEERAKRRQREMAAQGVTINLVELVEDIRRRDHSDANREHGALKQANDALLIDTSTLTFDEQVKAIIREAKKRGA